MAGASGFVGQRLCVALDRAGHDVVAMTRNPARYRGAGTPVRGDVQEPATLEPAMAGCQAGYYLVHSLQDADFAHKDATGATAFGEAAAGAGLDRIIYLGGLGDDADDLSAHLRSRREVESLLGTGGSSTPARYVTTSSTAIGWVRVATHRGVIMTGRCSTSWRVSSQEIPPCPTIIPARKVVTGTPASPSIRSTSRRLRRCSERSSSSSPSPPRYTIRCSPALAAA